MKIRNKNIHIYSIILILTIFIIYLVFKRRIDINSIFFIYDVYSWFGFYWKLQPQYCSPMKYGFNPVMPLEFYADFNQAIFQRIPTGDNTLNP
jgi:hypothetical protein